MYALGWIAGFLLMIVGCNADSRIAPRLIATGGVLIGVTYVSQKNAAKSNHE